MGAAASVAAGAGGAASAWAPGCSPAPSARVERERESERSARAHVGLCYKRRFERAVHLQQRLQRHQQHHQHCRKHQYLQLREIRVIEQLCVQAGVVKIDERIRASKMARSAELPAASPISKECLTRPRAMSDSSVSPFLNTARSTVSFPRTHFRCPLGVSEFDGVFSAVELLLPAP